MQIQQKPMFVPALDMKKVDPRLVEAAQGMEANFLKQMVKVMRDSVPSEDSDNRAIQLFQGMLDESYAEQTAKSQGIGLAEMIIRHMTQQVEVAPPRKDFVAENSLVGNEPAPVTQKSAEEWHYDSVKIPTEADAKIAGEPNG